MSRLNKAFYERGDVLQISRDLIGKSLVTNIAGQITSGLICETEAYAGIVDRASHAFGNRRTARTEVMYLSGGHAYVYLCYGIHFLFNVVTNVNEIPHAILIRGIIPHNGMDVIAQRRSGKWNMKSGIGPGNVSKCLGINLELNRENLTNSQFVWIEDSGIIIRANQIRTTARIGVDYAGEDAKLPYRFVWEK